jgi:hypothetical protein
MTLRSLSDTRAHGALSLLMRCQASTDTHCGAAHSRGWKCSEQRRAHHAVERGCGSRQVDLASMEENRGMRAEGRAAAPAGCSRYTEKRPLETDPPSDAAP